LLEEVAEVSPEILDHLYLLAGLPRNPDHQALAGVCRARSVAIMRPPLASEQSQEKDMTHRSTVAVDKQVIIASLNLHLLVEQAQAGHVHGLDLHEEAGDRDRDRDRGRGRSRSNQQEASSPHVLVELVHESNALFLRHKRNGDRAHGGAHLRDVRDLERVSERGSRQTQQQTYGEPESELDVPLLQSGGILTHLSLDNLCFQSMKYPDVMLFWETCLGISTAVDDDDDDDDDEDEEEEYPSVGGSESGADADGRSHGFLKKEHEEHEEHEGAAGEHKGQIPYYHSRSTTNPDYHSTTNLETNLETNPATEAETEAKEEKGGSPISNVSTIDNSNSNSNSNIPPPPP